MGPMIRVRLLLSLFLVLIGAFVAQAQQASRIPRIGVLRFTSAPALDPFQQPFRQGLKGLGYIEGKSILVEYRWAEGRADRAAQLPAELVALKVDVIVASVAGAVQAANDAATAIPIVMATAADPLGSAFVTNLARPGGNIRGLSITSPELAGKRLELVRQILPRSDRVAFLAHALPDDGVPA